MADITFGLSALVTLLAMVDPVGTVPVFLGIVLFAAGGQPLLRALRVSIPAFQIAGGVLLFLIAVDMLFARRSGVRETPEEAADAKARQDVSVFPLAIPMLSGPGTITATVLLMSRAAGDAGQIAMVAAAIVVAMAATLLVLVSAEAVRRVLGVTGIHVLTRVMGILLSALAVQMILDGLRAA